MRVGSHFSPGGQVQFPEDELEEEPEEEPEEELLEEEEDDELEEELLDMQIGGMQLPPIVPLV